MIAAFTSAVSINVMTSQIKGLLGLNEVRYDKGSQLEEKEIEEIIIIVFGTIEFLISVFIFFQIEGRGFRNTWLAVFQNIQQVNPVDATIGFGSLGIILLLRVSLCTDKTIRPA